MNSSAMGTEHTNDAVAIAAKLQKNSLTKVDLLCEISS